jgi:hypothetical protein
MSNLLTCLTFDGNYNAKLLLITLDFVINNKNKKLI